MLQNEYTCEIITPLVAKGADKRMLELRASALKGLMRFWWRTLHGHLSLEKLRKREGELFGESEMNVSIPSL
ncbi:type III-B CRISPR module RAMP protein Cmr1 [Geobacillus thermodenitrificans]|uniref:Type III-B CRISPR module RAMP protein Cmr1 n=1 Tax=Geobacillus thermodenitrificans TaxID=33940 RepID=A0ABY9Q7G3_GEOTD|nr:type III-B CRISPR module RAMP protein Cmr1 [Geobacillus thermodenitrificans]ATO38850.1 type III-B CRISPR module RAMP protein Cmr1 [Geobacillus thermodenitrificans]WMV74859.1 type III-B CRISPR module RAMP protein Cmr1 [Geobacillus thermodenitrificans]